MSARLFSLGFLLALMGAPALLSADLPAAKPTVAILAWLTGEWSFERNGRVVTERWTAPAGGMMIGTSQTVVGERTVEYEFVVIRADAAGDLLYIAKPSGQSEASFKLVRLSAREVVFENPTHDIRSRSRMCSRTMARCWPRSTARKTARRGAWNFRIVG